VEFDVHSRLTLDRANVQASAVHVNNLNPPLNPTGVSVWLGVERHAGRTEYVDALRKVSVALSLFLRAAGASVGRLRIVENPAQLS